jgi:hypothetical protein
MKSKILILVYILFSHTLVSAKGPDIVALFHELNRPEYRTDILPHDFSYLIKLLEYGKNSKKESDYAERVLRVYIRLVKGCPCINGYAFSEFLTKLPDLLQHCTLVKNKYISHTTPMLDMDLFDRFKESVNTVLYNQFLSDYDLFKKDPDNFLQDLSLQVLDIAQEEFALLQLRSSLMRFLEISMGKLVWSPDASEKVWDCTKKIATDLTKLTELAVIEDINDLDDLFWGLLYRFGFFTDLFASNLSQAFFDAIQHDMTQKKLLLINLEEQQDWLESKDHYLARTLKTSEAKMLAYQNGILTN